MADIAETNHAMNDNYYFDGNFPNAKLHPYDDYKNVHFKYILFTLSAGNNCILLYKYVSNIRQCFVKCIICLIKLNTYV